MGRNAFHAGPALAEKMLAEARRQVRARLGRQPAGSDRPARGPGHATTEQLRAVLFVLTGKLPPENLPDLPVRELAALAAKLQRSIARERGKARSGHRSYDVNRHIALHQAMRSLGELIERRRAGEPGGGATG